MKRSIVGIHEAHYFDISRFGPKVRAVRPRVVQALGYDVMLQCEVESFPTSAIDWTIRDFLIENEDRFRVTHFNTGPTSTRTTLKVCLLSHLYRQTDLVL